MKSKGCCKKSTPTVKKRVLACGGKLKGKSNSKKK